MRRVVRHSPVEILSSAGEKRARSSAGLVKTSWSTMLSASWFARSSERRVDADFAACTRSFRKSATASFSSLGRNPKRSARRSSWSSTPSAAVHWSALQVTSSVDSRYRPNDSSTSVLAWEKGAPSFFARMASLRLSISFARYRGSSFSWRSAVSSSCA